MNEPSINLEELAEAGVATVYEAAGQTGLVDVPLIQILPGSRAAGPARTVQCAPHDNLMVHAAVGEVQPGEILVLTMPVAEPVSLMGGLLAVQARSRGAAGVLIDAGVRDVDEIRDLGLPVWARFVTARAASKHNPGRLGVPVTVGGVTIETGDIVVLDGDGAVVVRPGDAARVAEMVRERIDREAAVRPRLEAGELTYDLHGLRGLVESPGEQA